MLPPGSRAVDRIAQEALALPVQERAELVRRLALSLDDSRPRLVRPAERPAASEPAAPPADDGTEASEPESDRWGPVASW